MNKFLSMTLALIMAFSIVTFSVLAAVDEGVAPDGMDPNAVQLPQDDLEILDDGTERFRPIQLTEEMFNQIFGTLAMEEGEGIHIYINGKSVVFPDTQPQIVEDRTMVPVRFVAEQLGAQVDYKYEDGKDIATIKKGNLSIVLIAGDKNALVNGINYVLDVPSVIINERMMVPFRFIFERFGMDVDYQERANASGNSISIILANSLK